MKQLVVVVAVAACGVGNDPPVDGSGGSTPGHITASTTWSGTQQLDVATTIDPGVTVTVMAGTTVSIKTGTKLVVAGVLMVQGTSGSKVTIAPASGAASFGGIEIPTGGQLSMSYATMTGGSIVTTGGKATLRDAQLSHAPGDLLIMNGGTVDAQYIAIGVEPPATDTTHCDAHFGGTGGNTITLAHSNLSTSAYGLMFYAGQTANIQYDNWFSNQTNVDLQPGVSGDFSSGYFQGTAPSGAGIMTNGLASARLPSCTGANDATCAGPRP